MNVVKRFLYSLLLSSVLFFLLLPLYYFSFFRMNVGKTFLLLLFFVFRMNVARTFSVVPSLFSPCCSFSLGERRQDVVDVSLLLMNVVKTFVGFVFLLSFSKRSISNDHYRIFRL